SRNHERPYPLLTRVRIGGGRAAQPARVQRFDNALQMEEGMAGFFDFLLGNPHYDAPGVRRLNLRYQFVVAPFRAEIEGSNLLDLASHDGRWAFAYASAGAKKVVGIEGRAKTILGFDNFPDCAAKRRVELRHADIFAALRQMRQVEEQYDVVSILGV